MFGQYLVEVENKTEKYLFQPSHYCFEKVTTVFLPKNIGLLLKKKTFSKI